MRRIIPVWIEAIISGRGTLKRGFENESDKNKEVQ